MNSCPFCTLDIERIRFEDAFIRVIRDGFPISPGHTLIIPKRHVGTFFEITEEERQAIFMALDAEKKHLDTEFSPDSYNIGINDGSAAGQTVPHLHVHLIPRYDGDCDDPRGGVRWILPDKAKYWED